MKKSVLNYLFIGLAFSIFSCTPQENGDANAEVSEAQDVKEVAATAATLSVNSETSMVSWIGSKPTGKHNGTIAIKSGEINTEGDAIVGGKITIDMNAIVSEDLKDNEDMSGKLIGHLKSPDFFDVANYPQAEFVITEVTALEEAYQVEVKEEFATEYVPASADKHIVDQPTHKVTGNLTLRDTTLSITFPANVSKTSAGIKAEAKFNIDRTLWNVKYGDEAGAVDKAKDKFIYNTVNVGFVLNATTGEGI